MENNPARDVHVPVHHFRNSTFRNVQGANPGIVEGNDADTPRGVRRKPDRFAQGQREVRDTDGRRFDAGRH